MRRIMVLPLLCVILLGTICVFQISIKGEISPLITPSPPRAADAHAPILVFSDSDLPTVLGILGGPGTDLSNSWIIHDFTIDAAGTGSPIEICNTTKFVSIINCTVSRSGSNFGDAGVHVYNTTNLQIINCSSLYNKNGIYIENSSITLEDNIVGNNSNHGIILNASSGNLLHNNHLGNNSLYGIFISSSPSNNFTHNNLQNNTRGFHFAGTTMFEILEGNNITTNPTSPDRGIVFPTSTWNVTIANNTIKGHETAGIEFGDSVANNTIVNNSVIFSSSLDYTTGISFGMFAASNQIISNNVSNNNQYGVTFNSGGVNNTLNANYISYNGRTGIWIQQNNQNTAITNNVVVHQSPYHGIELGQKTNRTLLVNNTLAFNDRGFYANGDLSNTTLQGNNMSFNNIGIQLTLARNTTVENNTIANNSVRGLDISGTGSFCNVLGNRIANTTGEAIWLHNSASSNNITGNNITQNDVGIEVQSDSPSNQIWLNCFSKNEVQARNYHESTKWHNGSYGNNWSDYTTLYPTANPNGTVWDTPYAIPGGYSPEDNFPLTTYPLASPNPPTLLTADQTIGQASITVSWSSVFNAQTYNVYVGITSVGSFTSTSTLLTFPGNGTYQVTVIAANQVGESAASNPATIIVAILPVAPVLQAPLLVTQNQTISSWSLLVEWNSVPGALSYNLYIDGVLIATVTTTACLINFTRVGVHVITITAIHPTGESPASSPITITVTGDESSLFILVIAVVGAVGVTGGFIAWKFRARKKQRKSPHQSP